MIDIRQLRYFIAIADEGQISRAAKRLNIAQPLLSLQLKLLEKQLGVQLIKRNTRNMILTEAGHSFHQHAEKIVSLFDSAVKEIKANRTEINGVLSFGSPPVISDLFIPDRLQVFHENYPQVHFQWREGYTFRILEWLESYSIEFGIVRLPVISSQYNVIPLITEPWVAVFGRGVAKGDPHSKITLDELANQPLLLLNRQTGIQAHDIVKKAFSATQSHPEVICESDSIMALMSLVERKMGVAIVPKSMLTHYAKRVDIREIDDEHLNSSVGIVWLKSRILSAQAQLFLKLFNPQ